MAQSATTLAGWPAALAGVTVAAWVALRGCPFPPPRELSWAGSFLSAVVYVLSVFLACAATMLVVYAMLLPRDLSKDVRQFSFGIASAAVWLAPLAVFTAKSSAWTTVVIAVLVAGLTRALALHKPDALEAPAAAGPIELFQVPAAPSLFQQLLPSLCASVSFQSGGVAALTGHLLPATTLSGIGASVVTWRYHSAASRGDAQSPSREPGFHAVLMIELATLVVAAALMWNLHFHYGFGNGTGRDSPEQAAQSEAMSKLLLQGHRTKLENTLQQHAGAGAAVNVGTIHRGIILWPETQPNTVLVFPMPAMHGSLPAPRVNPFSIPFFGVYWLYKAPDVRPPPDSFQARGNPAEHTFTTTDHEPLFMEARQDFGTLISLACCSQIQIGISNADPYIGTVSLELILVNSRLKGSPSQSLGIARVESVPPWAARAGGSPFPEVVTFTVPSASAIREFDEAVIRFKLDALRADTAAKTAVDRFLFVPR